MEYVMSRWANKYKTKNVKSTHLIYKVEIFTKDCNTKPLP